VHNATAADVAVATCPVTITGQIAFHTHVGAVDAYVSVIAAPAGRYTVTDAPAVTGNVSPVATPFTAIADTAAPPVTR